MSDLAIPTVHVNGTTRNRLVEQMESAVRALDEAIHRAREAEPNGRDYYPQGDEAIRLAVDQHGRRLRVLHEIRDEYAKIWEALIE